jgi:hypothetical protein
MSARPWDVSAATLYALCGRAWESRDTAEFPAAVDAILEAFDRAPLDWFEQCEREHEHVRWLVTVLRETDPSPPWWRATA